MRPGRRVAQLVCRFLRLILPTPMRAWASAILHEAESLSDEKEALRFALGAAFDLMPRAILWRLVAALESVLSAEALARHISSLSEPCGRLVLRPRLVGAICATGAVGLGLLHATTAGSPWKHASLNVVALSVGLSAVFFCSRSFFAKFLTPRVIVVTLSIALAVSTFLWNAGDGAARWASLAGWWIQPSAILLPLVIVVFSRCQSAITVACVSVVALAIALQGDLAMAAAIAFGLATLFLYSKGFWAGLALSVSVLSLTLTFVRPAPVEPASHVDQALLSSFSLSPIVGVLVLIALFLLFVPSLIALYFDRSNKDLYMSFIAVWLTLVIFSVLAKDPTPVVGFGGSAIIGYVISLLALPERIKTPIRTLDQKSKPEEARLVGRHLSMGTV